MDDKKGLKGIVYKRVKYNDLKVEEAQKLWQEIEFQSECDADNKIVKISLDLKNN
jgi:hypothetical protein